VAARSEIIKVLPRSTLIEKPRLATLAELVGLAGRIKVSPESWKVVKASWLVELCEVGEPEIVMLLSVLVGKMPPVEFVELEPLKLVGKGLDSTSIMEAEYGNPMNGETDNGREGPAAVDVASETGKPLVIPAATSSVTVIVTVVPVQTGA